MRVATAAQQYTGIVMIWVWRADNSIDLMITGKNPVKHARFTLTQQYKKAFVRSICQREVPGE
jgi:hypothetical protein